jgi:hypothetical protein
LSEHRGINRFSKFYKKYRDVLFFNKNLIISGIVAFFTGAFFTQFYSQQDSNNIINAIITLSVEYGVYIPIFVFLFYRDNKSKYIDPITQKKESKKIKSDIKKLVAAFSTSELIYSVSKITMHYFLLEQNIESYKASMIASLIAWIIFLIAINATANLVKLFKK